MKKLRVLALMHPDLVPPPDAASMSPEDRFRFKTEYDVCSTLQELGHEVRALGVQDELHPIRDAVDEFKPDVAFNLLEEFRGDTRYDAYILNDRFGIYALGFPVVSALDHLVHLAELTVLGAFTYVLLLAANAVFGALSRRSTTAPALLREVRASFYRKLFIAFVAAASIAGAQTPTPSYRVGRVTVAAGIAAAVARVLYEHGGNVEDSRMAILGGHFAMMLIVALPADADPQVLEGALAEPARALDMIGQTFGALARPAEKLPATYTVEPVQDGERVVTLRRSGDVQMVGLVYHVSAGSDDEFAATEAIAVEVVQDVECRDAGVAPHGGGRRSARVRRGERDRRHGLESVLAEPEIEHADEAGRRVAGPQRVRRG